MTSWLNRPSIVAVLYVAITLVMTWPVAPGIARDLPGDLGDPAFVAGMMAWAAEHWLALFRGDLGAASRFWDAPFFHPEPFVTAYSEHFLLQSLLTLPVFAFTRNAVLCYNLWFLATFVLTALGMYLFVRDVTAKPVAAVVAGLALAFAPYRIATMPHLQVLSAQWMPFVLLGIRRYLQSRDTNALLMAGAALWAQNLSSAYYMLYFGPFVALFVAVEMTARRLLRHLVVWRDLVVTGAVAVLATMPFVIPYLLRQRGARRPLFEVVRFSADLKSWLTASPHLNVWGHLQTFVKDEGFLFPGVAIVMLAAAGLWSTWRRPHACVVDRPSAKTVVWFGGLALVLSFWLALGPRVQIETQPTGLPSIYQLAYDYVPGFSSARVPARFTVITILALSVLASGALARLEAAGRRGLLAGIALIVLAEGSAFPLPTNLTWSSAPAEFHPADARLYRAADAPPVYRYLARLGSDTVVAHFPFGLPEREIQYGYYSCVLATRTVNGYSGWFPPSYNVRLRALRDPVIDPATAHVILLSDGVTHLVVHTRAWVEDRGRGVVRAFERAGWKSLVEFDGDVVLRRP
ncbi:MAG: hypothetical protein ACT4QD_22970 [Acidobacteriota bacterium]